MEGASYHKPLMRNGRAPGSGVSSVVGGGNSVSNQGNQGAYQVDNTTAQMTG